MYQKKPSISKGVDRLSAEVNYLLPNRHYTHIPTYAKVQYHDVYPGVDLIYYFNNHKLEYDFVISPGADIGPQDGPEELSWKSLWVPDWLWLLH